MNLSTILTRSAVLALTASLLPACWAAASPDHNPVSEAQTFECIEVDGPLQVTVMHSSHQSVEQETVGPRNFETTATQGCLRLTARDPNRPAVHLVVQTPALDRLRAIGGSHVAVWGVNAERLLVEARGGSRVHLRGVAHLLDARASGESSIDGLGLRATAALVSLTGASEAGLVVRERIEVEVSDDSFVRYVGSPRLLPVHPRPTPNDVRRNAT